MDSSGSLIKWLGTFDVEKTSKEQEDLTSGIVFSQILHQICPRHFSDVFVNSIKDASSNWRVKVSNLKKILKAISEYYNEELGQHIIESHIPDVTAIVERNDEKELNRLIQLILGCAVNCENKQEHVQRILNLDHSVQVAVMEAIKELNEILSDMNASETHSTTSSEELKKLEERLIDITEQRDVFAQRCHDLDQQVMILVEERTSLQAENEKLGEKLNQAENLDNLDNWTDLSDASTPAGRKFQQMQRHTEQLQIELEKSESAKDDLRIQVELLESDLFASKHKVEELNALALESRHLRDEMDILRNTADKVNKYEATIANYKKKLEDLSDVKSQMKLLEEKNSSYMQKNLDLEEEVKKLSVLKTQLDSYKRQVQDLQLRSSEDAKRANKAEFDAKRFQEKLTAVQREKERLEAERDSLKDMNEDLHFTQLQPKLDQPDGVAADTSLELMNLPVDVREKLVRLQHENKMLRLNQGSSESEGLLQSMLDDANTRTLQLECEVRSGSQRILELEAELEDQKELQQKLSSSEEGASSEMKKRFSEQLSKVQQLEEQLAAARSKAEELESKELTNVEEIEKLRGVVSKKEGEMKEMEDKYRRYLAKAKSVIKQLDPKYNTSSTASSAELQVLRQQLIEKDKYIQALEKERVDEKTQRDNEEALMISAWYNMSSSVNRKAAEDRLGGLGHSGGQQSFLARQRQAHVRRPTNTASQQTPLTQR